MSKSVGQWVGTIAGGVIGSFFGMPALGASIGGMVGGMIDPPKGPSVTGPRLEDQSFTSSTLGAALARGYGTFPVSGNVIWLEGDKYREVTTTESQGGKGGGGGSEVTSYTYYATFAVSLLRVTDPAQTVSLRRLWVGSNLVFDAGSDNLESVIASNLDEGVNFTFYNGADDQLPNPRWQADKGIDAVSGMPGRCYIVFEDLALEKYSNSLAMAQVKAELVIADTAPVQTALVDTISVGNLGDPVWGNTIIFHGIQFHSGGARYLTTEKYIYGDDLVYLNNGTMEFPHANDLASRNIQTVDGGYGTSWQMLRCCQFDSPVVLQYQNQYSGLTPVIYRWFYPDREEAWPSYLDHPDVFTSKHQTFAFDRGETFIAGANLTAKVAKISYANGVEAVSASAYSIINIGVSENYVFGLLHTPGSGNLTTTVYKFDRTNLALVDTYTDNAIGERGTICVIDDDTFYTAASASGYGNRLYKWVGGVVVKDFGSILPNTVSKAATLAVFNDNPLFGYIQDNEQVSNDPTALNIYLFSERVNAETASLRDTVTAECGLAGIASSDLDLSALTDHDVRGYRVTERGSVRAALEPLQAAFPFDVAQSGYKLRFVSRGGSSLATIPEEDLGTVATGEQAAVLLPVAREMDTQLPRKVSVRYLDVAREYDLGEQYAERPCNSVNERVVELPIAMNSQEAARTADVLLSKDWVERTEIGPFALPPTWSELEAADVVTVEHRGQAYEVRLTRVEYFNDGRLQCSANLTASQSYASTAEGEQPLTVGQSLVPLRGSSYGLLLDIPMILSAQDRPGIVAAAYGLASGWPGAVIVRSDDSGATYSSVMSTNVAASVFRATTALGSGRTDIIDAANVLTLTEVSKSPTLASVSFASAAAGQNLAAFGADGRWEIISFLTVTDNGDDTWTIRDFMRGRYGTEWAMSLHEAGDLMVVLSPSAVGFIGLPLAAVNSPRLYRTITQGSSLDSAADASFSYSATNLKPLACIYPKATRNPVSGDFIVEWTARSRYPVEPFSGVTTPVGEVAESYEVEIYSTGFNSLKRTVYSNSQSITYSYEDQVSDFGSLITQASVRIYKISGSIGRGMPLESVLQPSMPSNNYLSSLHFSGTPGSSVIVTEEGVTGTNVGTVTISGSNPKFGPTCLQLSSSFVYFYIPALANHGSSDITIEWWEIPSAGGEMARFVLTNSPTGEDWNGFFGCTRYDGQWGMMKGGGTSYLGTTSVDTANWTHVSLEKYGGVSRIFVNGTSVGADYNNVSIEQPYLAIGRGYFSGIPYFNGKIDDFIIYPFAKRQGANFSPPTSPFI